jgi:hypothetical protein
MNGKYMVAYEFYCIDSLKACRLIGVLPERRKDPVRISQESVMNWAAKCFGNSLDMKDIFFIEVKVDKTTGDILPPVTAMKNSEKE